MSNFHFLTARDSDRMLCPHPPAGAVLQVNPPYFAWLPANQALEYQIVVRDLEGRLIFQEEAGSETIYIPSKTLPAGQYLWDIRAWNGYEHIFLGVQSFTVPPDIPTLPYPDIKNLLASVPQSHPRFLYTTERIESVRATFSTAREKNGSYF